MLKNARYISSGSVMDKITAMTTLWQTLTIERENSLDQCQYTFIMLSRKSMSATKPQFLRQKSPMGMERSSANGPTISLTMLLTAHIRVNVGALYDQNPLLAFGTSRWHGWERFSPGSICCLFEVHKHSTMMYQGSV
eukprot:4758869-Amphidinium_carterae.1